MRNEYNRNALRNFYVKLWTNLKHQALLHCRKRKNAMLIGPAGIPKCFSVFNQVIVPVSDSVLF